MQRFKAFFARELDNTARSNSQAGQEADVKKEKAQLKLNLAINGVVSDHRDNVARLSYLWKRFRGGHLMYQRCSFIELSEFFWQRGLGAVKPKPRSKKSLIAALEQADEQPVFERFLELPPELRAMIFAYAEYEEDGEEFEESEESEESEDE
ncbi:hypothetical protein LTR56_001167 [Elasticomyces elasticus]|nr:hypothetical protein LTR22_016203 [Elasticomyces elasticus]KAK3659803.1 hypothetical protein LTR56_001167 [Elasticomyces elasticus]KAK4914321.1 hypothetical protein LTR49_017459 [Elasticomyces elasticus]KAK5769088.1 hypothetical protein LTS12_000802 [Elasticomyces elasticus]